MHPHANDVALLLVLNRGAVARLYTQDPEVVALAGTLLAFVAGYHLFDCVQAVAVNVLRGYKRAVVPMAIYAIALWGVGLGGGYVLGLRGVEFTLLGLDGPMGAAGFWTAAIASLLLAGTLVGVYFLKVSAAAAEDTPADPAKAGQNTTNRR